MTRDAMRRLQAANPIPVLPPVTPITAVLPEWERLDDREGSARGDGLAPRRSPRRWTRSGSVLLPVFSVTVAVVIGLVALTTVHPGHRSTQSAASGHAARYSDPEGWSVSYPAGFTVRRSRSDAQVTLSSFAPARTVTGRSQQAAPYTMPLDSSGRFPADGVALILQPSRSFVIGPDSRFPIQIGQFGLARAHLYFSPAVARRDGIPPARSDQVVAYSRLVTATAIIGPKASPTLRKQLAEVIKSLGFRRLAPGSQVPNGYIVGPASRFPVGSFTRIEARFLDHRTAVYLVHAPGRFTVDHQCPTTGSCTQTGAFYGMGETYNTRLGHAPNCQIQLDRNDKQFYCTNLGVRWDRVGRVVKQPAGEKYIGAIGGDYAKRTWDGQIMLIPGWGPQLSRGAVHLLWPHWHQPKHPNLL
jgi:hypothetical protein